MLVIVDKFDPNPILVNANKSKLYWYVKIITKLNQELKSIF
jgi:hypothetical protein